MVREATSFSTSEPAATCKNMQIFRCLDWGAWRLLPKPAMAEAHRKSRRWQAAMQRTSACLSSDAVTAGAGEPSSARSDTAHVTGQPVVASTISSMQLHCEAELMAAMLQVSKGRPRLTPHKVHMVALWAG